MTEWAVTVVWDATGEVSADALAELANIGGAAGGWPDTVGTRLDVTVTVTAPDPAAAAAQAVTAVTDVVPGTVAVVEVLTTAEQDRRLVEPAFPELVGVSEVAKILGVSRQRASALQSTRGFPAPVAVLSSGPVWRRADLGRFEEEWQRKPGRPPAPPRLRPRIGPAPDRFARRNP